VREKRREREREREREKREREKREREIKGEKGGEREKNREREEKEERMRENERDEKDTERIFKTMPTCPSTETEKLNRDNHRVALMYSCSRVAVMHTYSPTYTSIHIHIRISTHTCIHTHMRILNMRTEQTNRQTDTFRHAHTRTHAFRHGIESPTPRRQA